MVKIKFDPFTQNKFCYRIFLEKNLIGEVFVLDPKYIRISRFRRGLVCIRK
jgi:hypothetical protein